MDTINIEDVVKNLNNLRLVAGLGLIASGVGIFAATLMIQNQDNIINKLRRDVENLKAAAELKKATETVIIQEKKDKE